MQERVEMKSPQQRPSAGGWRGYGLLAAAWLSVLGAGGVAAWLVHTGVDADRPVRTAALYSGPLPDAPAPTATPVSTATDQTGPLDPRFRQIATRVPGPAGLRDLPVAPPAPAATALDEAPAEPGTAIPRIPAGAAQSDGAADEDGDAVADLSDDRSPHPSAEPSPDPAGVQVAALASGPQDDTTAAGPMPPPVPRSIVSAPFGGAQAGTASRYSVQVGAFRLRENAVERAARLSAAGYEVRIVHVFATHSRLYMVRIGQFDARPAAMAYARQLARDVAVETWPVRN
jgi:cell division septation protein DedD